ncbi:type II secretion system protein GspC [uncultured Psychromonas sp.]|uniref:type II secretion system protein GspC n=1 Tax=uncultured Psychromonas sp. TaxID=173974 RepID=UPI00262BCFDC|nr:type II secretion system protein GspC [uncultured Psychromonas sp.]
MISLLPKIILAVICALIAYQSGVLTWSLYPVKETPYHWTPTAQKTENKTVALNTKKLQEQALFGQYKGEGNKVINKESLTEAPKTRLKLTLVGIVASSEPQFSSVIIEYKRVQDSYFIDSEISGTDAIVTEIYSDRIIISVNGEKQTLILDGLEQANKRMDTIEKGQEVNAAPKKRRGRTKKTKEIDLDRDSLVENPDKLLDYISISPVRDGNQIKGYRVNPGKKPELFEDAGLQPDDLVVELNGVDLTDISEALGLMKEFPTMTEMSLTVDRDGELNELFISIP